MPCSQNVLVGFEQAEQFLKNRSLGYYTVLSQNHTVFGDEHAIKKITIIL